MAINHEVKCHDHGRPKQFQPMVVILWWVLFSTVVKIHKFACHAIHLIIITVSLSSLNSLEFSLQFWLNGSAGWSDTVNLSKTTRHEFHNIKVKASCSGQDLTWVNCLEGSNTYYL